jgi:hypothetical protein
MKPLACHECGSTQYKLWPYEGRMLCKYCIEDDQPVPDENPYDHYGYIGQLTWRNL